MHRACCCPALLGRPSKARRRGRRRSGSPGHRMRWLERDNSTSSPRQTILSTRARNTETRPKTQGAQRGIWGAIHGGVMRSQCNQQALRAQANTHSPLPCRPLGRTEFGTRVAVHPTFHGMFGSSFSRSRLTLTLAPFGKLSGKLGEPGNILLAQGDLQCAFDRFALYCRHPAIRERAQISPSTGYLAGPVDHDPGARRANHTYELTL